MTPEQLQQYIDAALRQRDQFNLVFYPLVIILSLGGAWLLSYLREKGKNLATKEDVGQITTKIESAKTEFAERLEKVRASLEVRSHYSRVRYEREMKTYEEVWTKLCGLKDAALSLRPVMDSSLKEGQTEEDRKRERAGKFIDCYMQLSRAVDYSRPFYPPGIWIELRQLLDLCWKEGVQYRFRGDGRGMIDYWDQAMENAKAITSQVDKTCEAIRSRLTDFDSD